MIIKTLTIFTRNTGCNCMCVDYTHQGNSFCTEKTGMGAGRDWPTESQIRKFTF